MAVWLTDVRLYHLLHRWWLFSVELNNRSRNGSDIIGETKEMMRRYRMHAFCFVDQLMVAARNARGIDFVSDITYVLKMIYVVAFAGFRKSSWRGLVVSPWLAPDTLKAYMRSDVASCPGKWWSSRLLLHKYLDNTGGHNLQYHDSTDGDRMGRTSGRPCSSCLVEGIHLFRTCSERSAGCYVADACLSALAKLLSYPYRLHL